MSDTKPLISDEEINAAMWAERPAAAVKELLALQRQRLAERLRAQADTSLEEESLCEGVRCAARIVEGGCHASEPVGCPECNGGGRTYYGMVDSNYEPCLSECRLCGGTGTVERRETT